jgi:biotin carboxyl carrier protein
VRYEIETGGRLRQVTVNRVGGRLAVTIDGRLYRVDAARVDAHTMSLMMDNGVSAGAQHRGAAERPEQGLIAPASGPHDPLHAVGAPYDWSGASTVYTATVAPAPEAGRYVVQVGAVPVRVDVNGRRVRGQARGTAAGPLRIAAPMPGKVVRILVKAGDAVRARQPIIVVEAMKMENELRADRDGTVGEIHVREGVSVEAGTLLVVIQ